MQTEFAPEGRLQLRRALDDKDDVALESLALRYYGTTEAAEALLWLGDRQLVDGEPALAVGRYRQALRMADGALRQRIGHRLQLTAAMLGQPVTSPPAANLEFGETRFSPAALQALRKERREAGVDSRWSARLPPQLAPTPTAFDVAPRGRFEGELGDRPEVVPVLPPAAHRPDIDWFARQVALAVDSNRLIVSNRFQVACYELPSGKLQWRTALSRDPAHQEQPAPAFEYALTPMVPVIAGPRLFVRRLMRGPSGPPNTSAAAVATLACLELETGKVLWSTANHRTGRLHYVSDPVVIQDQVFAIGQKQTVEEESLILRIHDRFDGTLLAERPLSLLRSSFDEQRGCQLTALEDCCLATVGGSILCFDLAGNIRWARRPLWVPPEADPHWLVQSHEPPLVAGDHCYLVQPGVLNLVCLDPDSGRLRWQKAIVGLRRLAGLVGGRLIVQTDGGFVSLDAATGKEHWRHHVRHLLTPPLCGGPGGLTYGSADFLPGEKEPHRPTLVWVDLETGREKTRFPLDSLQSVQPRLGPLFTAGDRLWAFSGKGNELARSLIELVPPGLDLPTTQPATAWEAWARTVPGPMHAAAARALPGWTVFDSKPNAKMGQLAEFLGQRDVLCAWAPFVIGRHIEVPVTDKPRLLLRVNHEAKGACLLVVDADGKRIGQQEVSSATTGDQWKDWEVDLSAYKGQRIWVVVRHLPRDSDTTCSLWGKIELLK